VEIQFLEHHELRTLNFLSAPYDNALKQLVNLLREIRTLAEVFIDVRKYCINAEFMGEERSSPIHQGLINLYVVERFNRLRRG